MVVMGEIKIDTTCQMLWQAFCPILISEFEPRSSSPTEMRLHPAGKNDEIRPLTIYGKPTRDWSAKSLSPDCHHAQGRHQQSGMGTK